MSPAHRRNSQGASALNEAAGSSSDSETVTWDPVHGPWPCSSPKGCLYNNGSNAEHILITVEDVKTGLDTVVKTICSNENCQRSPYMHTACFQAFEETVLAYLKGQGRARAWSDKQKLQNLWTKRGYDLVYKACDCKCGHGHIRKDLDWMPNSATTVLDNNNPVHVDQEGKRKRKKSKSSGLGKPTITIGLPAFGAGPQVRSKVTRSSPFSPLWGKN